MTDLDLLQIQYRTIFETDASDRILRENDPDHSGPPLLWLAGSTDGNVFAVRADVAANVEAEIARLLAAEPPFVGPHADPRSLDRILRLLTKDGVAPKYNPGVVYELRKDLSVPGGITCVDSDSEGGRALHARLAAEGMPPGLRAMGFLDAAEFWPPWCAALADGVPVSVCFAARLSAKGAEAGVATAADFRRRGFAAAATAGWTRLNALASHTLFYSTDRTNVASQRVAAKLGLRRIGNRMTLA